MVQWCSGTVVTMLNWGGDAVLGGVLRVDIDPLAVCGSPPKVGRVCSARTGANLAFFVAVGNERVSVSVSVSVVSDVGGTCGLYGASALGLK